VTEGMQNMDEHQCLADQFEVNRDHLQAVSYRMLGSLSEANDAVQEAWLRLNRTDASEIENLTGWLTTVVVRICLDMLRSRKAQREESLDEDMSERLPSRETGTDPEQEALLADSVGLGLLVVLDTLNPPERLAFVLHDIFAMSFKDIAPLLERSESAVRQLASRARRRVQGTVAVKSADLTSQREVVNAFLTASREGSFEALLAVLDPDVVFRADAVMIANTDAAAEIRGAEKIARQFLGRAQNARPVLMNGSIGVLAGHPDHPFFVLKVAIANSKIVEIEAIGDPAHFHKLHLSVLAK
jgi:RNA polymerase sigma factor (sigma-70 family)